MADQNEADLESHIAALFEEADEVEDIEIVGLGAGQAIKVAGASDQKGKKTTVIKKPAGPDDTGGKKKRVLPKVSGGADERKKRKA